MPDQRVVDFDIDPTTWPAASPPAALTAAAQGGSVTLDLNDALLFTGIWTRPPVLHGFSLSDCWAWLRYYAAFSTGPALRLRDEWSTLDPHHKTVASGDLGVGVGSLVLQALLGFQRYADVLWVVNVLEPGQWQLGRVAKRGPSKSPDYVAYDNAGQVSVVECKGGQTSRAALRKSVVLGIPQKANLLAVGGQQLIHRLVVGVFIPQHACGENALVHVSDPEGDESIDLLRKHTTQEIRRAVDTIALAKEIAMFDMTETVAMLVGLGDAGSIAEAIDRDLEQRGEPIDGSLRVVRELRWSIPLVRGDEEYRGVRFTGQLPLTALAPVQAGNVDGPLIGDGVLGWVSANAHDLGSEMVSPIGATYRVDWLQ